MYGQQNIKSSGGRRSHEVHTDSYKYSSVFSLFFNRARQIHEYDEAINLDVILVLTYLVTAIGLTPGDSSTVHIYTQTVHRTTQLTTLVGRISGIRTQIGQTKINDELTT